MKENFKTLVPCGCSHCRDWKERIIRELAEMYKGEDFSAHVLIQHLLAEDGETILRKTIGGNKSQ